MIPAEQHSVPGQPRLLRGSVSKFSELNGSLPSITAQLIHLARGRFDVQN